VARTRRRYELHSAELNRRLEELLELAERELGPREGSEFARQMLVTSLRLLEEGSAADLKFTNATLKELRHAQRVFRSYEHVRKVAVFGSARTPADHPDWIQAQTFAERMVADGWMVITGAGEGIMEAAQGGAGRHASFGVNIRLPFEQRANRVIEGDPKLINFRYFFTRKVTFVRESHALALFPGGFGTHDEGFEALTLIQTGKSELVPVVFVDAPGAHYWRDWQDYVESHLLTRGLISPEDRALFRVTDDVDEAVREIDDFYRNYHSSRYVGEKLVIRLRHAPDDEALASLSSEFEDILLRGAIEHSAPLAQEGGDVPELPRILLRFDRRRVGRLRQLVDRLNELSGVAGSTRDASPREIVSLDLPPEAEEAEEA
jgi:uncharacterized protein (TIGR00730 family)